MKKPICIRVINKFSAVHKISITTGFKGGLQSRAGYAVECAEQLPEKEQDYLKGSRDSLFSGSKNLAGNH